MDKSFTQLLAGYEQGILSEKEMEQFFELLKSEENKLYLGKSIDKKLIQENTNDNSDSVINENRFIEAVSDHSPKINRFFHNRFWWVAACIALLVMAGAAYYQNIVTKNKQNAQVVNNALNDAAPGKNGAILKLSDGALVNLDSAASGLIGRQNGTDVFLDNGQLKYKELKDSKHTLAQTYNIVETPAGRQFKLTLPDATTVWLNAGSSIKFPTQFTGTQRIVEVSGEVYMEVASNKSKPFIVNIIDGYSVEVLGTHFNINAYHNEDALRTTLLEGKIKVKPTHPDAEQLILLPGQEALGKEACRF